MKAHVLVGLVWLSLAGSALGGGPTVVGTDPVPVPPAPAPAMHDWSGGYVGLSFGATSASVDFSSTGEFDFDDGTVLGLHGGYLFQRGSLVYGGELAYGAVGDTQVVGFVESNEIERILDLKARLGYATNRVLFYGVLGYSFANYVEPAGREFDVDGFAYGVGVDFAASDRLVFGLEYLSRDLSGSASDDSSVTGDFDLDTLSLRVGFSF
jgi:outer membrane immunogenic protein